MLPIISSPDQTTIHPAEIGHQPLLSSHCFDFGEICSYGCGQPQSVNRCPPVCARAPVQRKVAQSNPRGRGRGTEKLPPIHIVAESGAAVVFVVRSG
jgi:hypothetical protein